MPLYFNFKSNIEKMIMKPIWECRIQLHNTHVVQRNQSPPSPPMSPMGFLSLLSVHALAIVRFISSSPSSYICFIMLMSPADGSALSSILGTLLGGPDGRSPDHLEPLSDLARNTETISDLTLTYDLSGSISLQSSPTKNVGFCPLRPSTRTRADFLVNSCVTASLGRSCTPFSPVRYTFTNLSDWSQE